MENILNKAESSHSLTKEHIISLLSTSEFDNTIFNIANNVRKKYIGDKIHLRGLIEFSNICPNTCFYCGLRGENTSIKRFTLSKDLIIKSAKNAAKYGYKTIVLQSGESKVISDEELCSIISEIKKLDMAITLSIGEKTEEEYKSYKEAGADRFLLRIETTDKELYKKYHPKMNFENRVNCLKILKQLGYEVGTGCLVGLPEQTVKSLADDILFFKEIGADMVGLGPFIPCPHTPLENTGIKNHFVLALKVMAITRILLPDINIPATTAMESLQKGGAFLALNSGANVIMPNVSLYEERENYQIYPNKFIASNDVKTYRENLETELAKIGRFVSKDKGFRAENK